MFCKLPHPFLGVLAFLLVWVAGTVFVGFGVGVPELIVLTLLASMAFAVVNRHPTPRRYRTG